MRILMMLVGLVPVLALGQVGSPLPSTVFTRDWLRSTNATEGYLKLGLASTNQTTITNWITTNVFPNGVVISEWNTNYSAPATNWIYITGAGTIGANGAYYWATNGYYAGSNIAYGIDVSTGTEAGMLTNGAADMLYAVVTFPTEWSVFTGDPNAPTGGYGTQTLAVASLKLTGNSGPIWFNNGIDARGNGGVLNLGGLGSSLRSGIDPVTGDNYDAYPSVIAGSAQTYDTGFMDANLACNQVTNRGKQVAILASAQSMAEAYKNNLFVGAAELSVISNYNGASASIALLNSVNLAYGNVFVAGAAGSYLDPTTSEMSLIYGNQAKLTNVFQSVAGANISSMSGVSRGIVFGNNLTVNTSSNVFVFGSGLNITGKTDYMELGVANGTVSLVGTVSANGAGITNLPNEALRTTNTPSAGNVLKYNGTNMYWAAP